MQSSDVLCRRHIQNHSKRRQNGTRKGSDIQKYLFTLNWRVRQNLLSQTSVLSRSLHFHELLCHEVAVISARESLGNDTIKKTTTAATATAAFAAGILKMFIRVGQALHRIYSFS